MARSFRDSKLLWSLWLSVQLPGEGRGREGRRQVRNVQCIRNEQVTVEAIPVRPAPDATLAAPIGGVVDGVDCCCCWELGVVLALPGPLL